MTSNAQRSASTQARLIAVARGLFGRDGYAATGTEAILDGAGVRRGAMYHHFADKAALFEAVCLALSEEALPVIEAATVRARDPLDVLVRGSIAWIGYATRDDVRRILLVDAPNVLGWERWEALDQRLSAQALHTAVGEALKAKAIVFGGSAEMLATMANGALNALALRVGAPGSVVSSREWQKAVRALWAAFAAT